MTRERLMHARLAMKPVTDQRHIDHRYPGSWVCGVRRFDGRDVTLRPVQTQDIDLFRAFVRAMSPLTRYRRFHGPVSELPERTLREMNDVDQSSHLALLAETFDPRQGVVQVAEARWIRRSDPSDVADFALAVADDWQGCGLGTRLLAVLEQTAAQAGVGTLRGDVLADNAPMRELLRRRGWRLRRDPEDWGAMIAERDLRQQRQTINDRFALAAA